MRGRAGDDTYWVENAADTVVELSGQGIDEVRTSVSWTITGTADIETLRATDEALPAVLNLTGNLSGNTIIGNDGVNVIDGRDGSDTLNGRAGPDTLIGGAGLDSYLFDTLLGAGNVDTIMDFNVADDTIVLENAIFAALPAGSLTPDRFAFGTMALSANVRILYDSTTGNLFYDSDGLGGSSAIRFAQLNGAPALTHLDFLVV
jgi:Ca2+-binding RTX toxin-like protein